MDYVSQLSMTQLTESLESKGVTEEAVELVSILRILIHPLSNTWAMRII